MSSFSPKTVTFKEPVEEVEEVQPAKINLAHFAPNPWAIWWNSVPDWAKVVVAVMVVICLAIWIAGLVRMGHCGGRKSWLWWVTIFVPLFIPGIGQLWGLVVGIVALVMLRKGGKMLTMQCSK